MLRPLPKQKRKRKSRAAPKNYSRNSAVIKAQKVWTAIQENPGKPIGEAMREAGYATATSLKPSDLTDSKAWNDLLDEYLPRTALLGTHQGLLRASHLDHMTFPLETPALLDSHIVEMLAELNCKVRRVVHGETARHVYFWSPDNKARNDALEKGYKLRGDYAPEKHIHGHFSLLKLGQPKDAPLLEQPSQVPQIDDIES